MKAPGAPGGCAEVRDRLLGGSSAGHPGTARHLAACAECAEFAARLDRFRGALRERHAGHEPDASFATRVAARIDPPADLLGRVALRLLPHALALAVLFAALDWRLAVQAERGSASGQPGISALADDSPEVDESSGDAAATDLVAWLAGSAEEEDEP